MNRLFKFTLIFLFTIAGVNAQQDFQGKAYYESKTTMDMDFGGRQMSEEMKKQIAGTYEKYV